MAYYQEERVERLMDNWGGWAGNGGVHPSGGGSPLSWLDAMIGKVHSSSVPVLAGVAADTQVVLERMEVHLREALVIHYTGGALTLERELGKVNAARIKSGRLTISQSTYIRHMHRAHEQFIALFDSYRERMQGVALDNAATASAGKSKPLNAPRVRLLRPSDVENTKTNDGNEE